MSGGDLLRRAAKRLRERAEGATPGPWYRVGPPWNRHEPFIVAGAEDPHVGRFVCDLDDPVELDDDAPERDLIADAEHIALMHPPVAIALADWLESNAAWMDRAAELLPGRRSSELDRTDQAAVAVARAILREPS